MRVRSPSRLLFTEAIAVPDSTLDLVRVALLVAGEDDPDTAASEAYRQFDRFKADLPDDFAGREPRVQLEILVAYLHGAQGFHGNHDNYYDPRNSLFTQVVARRTGIPLTLALLYMEAARRCGVTLLPIGLPGHLMIRHSIDQDLYLDPFSGDLLDTAGCLQRVFGLSAEMHVPTELLEPLQPRPFLLRLLTNLKGAYLRSDPPQLDRALAAAERILLLYPDTLSELRDCGLLRLQLGQRTAALTDLDRYCARAQHADDFATVLQQTQSLYLELSLQN